MEKSVKNVFVFGADAFNMSQMRALDLSKKIHFHVLFDYDTVIGRGNFQAEKLHKEALEQLNQFPGSIDAIVGYWDFPVSTMLPLLRRPFHLPSPTFEAVLKCEHKYWSRVLQNQIMPEFIPDYCAVDPFADNYRSQICLDYPFWIKPVKSASSHLGFKVTNDQELEHAIDRIRQNISRFGEPLNYLLQFADIPADIAAIDGYHCIAESIISSGRQCTLEGYVYNGEITIYGVVDSLREGTHRSSFSRYQYPSTIPRRIQRQMFCAAERFLKYIKYDNGPFNIEFYWQSSNNNIKLLEVNTRISKSHCPLFHDVDGASNQKVMLETALGMRPDFPHRQGDYKIAAKFMWRAYEDAVVKHLPSETELRRLHERFPSAQIQLEIEEGTQLSTLIYQDSYSYEIGVIFLGGNSQKELLAKYQEIKEAMHIEFEPVS
jgi:biotin carboxylase